MTKTLFPYPDMMPLIEMGNAIIYGTGMEDIRLFNLEGCFVRQYNHLKTNELIIKRDGIPKGFYLNSARLYNGRMATGKLIVH